MSVTNHAPKKRRDWKKKFLAVLADTCNVSAACKAADVNRKHAYDRYHADLEFAQKWDDAINMAVDAAEGELYRRAVKGVEKPVFQGGEEVGRIREYSDTCLIFHLKGKRPAIWREPKGEVHIHNEAPAIASAAAQAGLEAATKAQAAEHAGDTGPD